MEELLPVFSVPQKRALRFCLKEPEQVLLWPGSIRSGKTFSCAWSLFLYSMKFQNKQFILGGRTVASIYRNIRPYLEMAANHFGINIKTVQSKEVLLIGANEFHCFGANNEKSQDAMQGMTAQGALLDEAPLLPESFIKQAIARCSEPEAKIMMTMNKTSPFHWIKTEWVDRAEEKGITVIESDLSAAHWLTDRTKQMYDSLLTGYHGKRMLLNEWAAAEGLCYSNYESAIRPCEVDAPITYVSVDWGMAHITAALAFKALPKDPDNRSRRRYMCSGEYYEKGEYPVEYHAEKIVAQFCEDNPRVYVDPSAIPLKTALRKAGAHVASARNDLIPGIAVTDAALARQDILLDPELTPNLIAELSNLVWDPKAQEKGEDKPIRGNDHAADCLRYFAYKRYPPKGLNAPVSKPRGLH